MTWLLAGRRIAVWERRRRSPVDAPERSLTSARIRYADPELIRKAVQEYARDLRSRHEGIRSIRWFGSWVKGTAGVGSDVDLCVIVDRSDKSRRDRMPDFLPRSFPVGIDLFVYTVAEWATLRAEHSTLAVAIDGGVEL